MLLLQLNEISKILCPSAFFTLEKKLKNNILKISGLEPSSLPVPDLEGQYYMYLASLLCKVAQGCKYPLLLPFPLMQYFSTFRAYMNHSGTF